MMNRLRPGAGAVLALLPLLAGCYSYVPVGLESVAPPAAVRAHLSSEGAPEVREVLGERPAVLDGELTAVTPEGIYLLVPGAVVQRGTRAEPLYQELLIPRREIASLQRRELDRVRTGALAAAGALVAGAILQRALSGERGGDPTPPGNGGAVELSFPARPSPRP